MTTQYIGRFAPSPTGPLHIGSLVAALASYLDARCQGGRWLVRMEDVDSSRCKTEWADTILRQLEALQLHWDGEVMVQSHRTRRYLEAFNQLLEAKQVYACVCSRREIADSAVSGIDGPVYPGTCRGKGVTGPEAAWRVITASHPISFRDAIQGEVSQVLDRDVGDFVLKRRDGLFSYQLAVVVDDADQGITHIVRGADLLASTPRQIHLQRLLGLPACEYSHLPVAVNGAGQKLSKQTLAPALDPTTGVDLLNQVLQYLGQPTWEAGNPQELLNQAVSAWQSSRIARRATLPAPVTRSLGTV